MKSANKDNFTWLYSSNIGRPLSPGPNFGAVGTCPPVLWRSALLILGPARFNPIEHVWARSLISDFTFRLRWFCIEFDLRMFCAFVISFCIFAKQTYKCVVHCQTAVARLCASLRYASRRHLHYQRRGTKSVRQLKSNEVIPLIMYFSAFAFVVTPRQPSGF